MKFLNLSNKQAALMGLWVVLPGVILITAKATAIFWINWLRGEADPNLLDGLMLVIPLVMLVLPMLSTLTLALVLNVAPSSWSWRKSATVLGIGFIIQTCLALVSAISITGTYFSDLMDKPGKTLVFNLYPVVPAAISQLAFAGLFAAFSGFSRLSKVVVSILSGVVLIVLAVGFFLWRVMN